MAVSDVHQILTSDNASYSIAETNWLKLMNVLHLFDHTRLYEIIQKMLYRYPQLINVRGVYRLTMINILYSRRDQLELLIEMGADLNIPDCNLLGRVLALNQIEPLETILKAGAKFEGNSSYKTIYISLEAGLVLIKYKSISWNTPISLINKPIIPAIMQAERNDMANQLLLLDGVNPHEYNSGESLFEFAWEYRDEGALMSLDNGIAFPPRLIIKEADRRERDRCFGTLLLLYSFEE
jgi:hypothetical protein